MKSAATPSVHSLRRLTPSAGAVPVLQPLPEDVERVTKPHIVLERSKTADEWIVKHVPADHRKTKWLSAWPNYDDAAQAAKMEAECRGLPVPATALMGGAHV